MHLIQTLPLTATLLFLSLTTASPLANPNSNTDSIILGRDIAPSLEDAALFLAAAKSKRQNDPHPLEQDPRENSPVFQDFGNGGSDSGSSSTPNPVNGGGVTGDDGATGDGSVGKSVYRRLGRRRAVNDNDNDQDFFASTSGAGGTGHSSDDFFASTEGHPEGGGR